MPVVDLRSYLIKVKFMKMIKDLVKTFQNATPVFEKLGFGFKEEKKDCHIEWIKLRERREKMVDLKKVDQLLNRMSRAAEEIKEIIPEFEWSYKVNIEKTFSSVEKEKK